MSRRLQLRARPTWLTLRIGAGGAESNSPSRVWSPRCSPEHAGKWLAAPGSNRARRVNSAVHSPRLLAAKTGAEDEDRTRIMSLEGSGPAIGRPPRRRGMESNHHPAFFKRVREPSLLPRQNWLRDQELHLATPAYEAGSTLGLPALRNLAAAVGYDPTRSRQSARSRALIRRTRSPAPTAESERGTGNDPATSCLASKRSPTELPPHWWRRSESNRHWLLAKQRSSR